MERQKMVKIKNVLAPLTLIFLPFFSMAQDKVDATVIREETELWTLSDDGSMSGTKSELNAGSTVGLYLVEDGGKQIPETVSAEIKLSWNRKTTQDFSKISYDGGGDSVGDFYVFSSSICAGGIPAVVTSENACLYRTKNPADITSLVLSRSKVVCLKGTFKIAGGKEMSYITYYDDASSSQRSGYVKTEKISTNRDDITALRTLRKINASNNQKLRTDLVSTLRDLNVSGSVLELIGEAEMRTLRATDLSLAGVMDIYPQKFTYLVEDDYLNIRDIPSKSGKTLGRLEFEEEFIAIRKTLATQTFDGNTDSWYYGVANGIDGWIFGGYLTLIEEEVEDEELLDEGGETGDEHSASDSDSTSGSDSESSGNVSGNDEPSATTSGTTGEE